MCTAEKRAKNKNSLLSQPTSIVIPYAQQYALFVDGPAICYAAMISVVKHMPSLIVGDSSAVELLLMAIGKRARAWVAALPLAPSCDVKLYVLQDVSVVDEYDGKRDTRESRTAASMHALTHAARGLLRKNISDWVHGKLRADVCGKVVRFASRELFRACAAALLFAMQSALEKRGG